jgi:hypothetical protein
VWAGCGGGGARRGCHVDEGGAPLGWLHGRGAVPGLLRSLRECGCPRTCCLANKRKRKEKEEKKKRKKKCRIFFKTSSFGEK